jgi:glucosamine--fructose-6-phosphate aminotransferase (isomerizing)
LNDNEFAVIYKNKIRFYDKDLTRTNNKIKVIEWDNTAADKNGFDNYMLKEIYEQPSAIRNTINSRIEFNSNCNFEDLNITSDYLKSINKIYVVACGTAMYAGLVGKDILESLCQIPVSVEVASEFRYRNPIIDDKTLCIYISQSGETADTIAALKLAKTKGAKTLAISNVIGSSITREADFTIYTNAGPEIAVASTKAYTSQIVLLATLSIYFAELLNSSNRERLDKLKTEIANLPLKI